MKLFVNGIEETDCHESKQTLGEFMEYVSMTHISPAEIISQVKVDGEAIAWHRNDTNINSCSLIEVTTSHAKDILVSGLLEAYRLSQTLEERLEGIADGLGTFQHQKSIHDFVECLDTLQWFYTVMTGVERLLGVSVEDGSTEKSYFGPIESLRTVLVSLVKAFQEENYVLLADIIRYELSPAVRDLLKFIPLLIKQADKKLLTLC